jgi:hypothetical protein
MRARLTLLIRRVRRRRDGYRRYEYWPLGEPVVPALRGWPVDPPRR